MLKADEPAYPGLPPKESFLSRWSVQRSTANSKQNPSPIVVQSSSPHGHLKRSQNADNHPELHPVRAGTPWTFHHSALFNDKDQPQTTADVSAELLTAVAPYPIRRSRLRLRRSRGRTGIRGGGCSGGPPSVRVQVEERGLVLRFPPKKPPQSVESTKPRDTSPSHLRLVRRQRERQENYGTLSAPGQEYGERLAGAGAIPMGRIG